MTSAEIRAVRASMGLSAQQFATLIGVTARTVRRWEDGTRMVPVPVMRLLKLQQQTDMAG